MNKRTRVNENLSQSQASPSKKGRGDDFENAEKALLYLSTLFPHEQFCGRVPRTVMKHMVYSLLKDRTKADRELGALQAAGKVRFFKLGNEDDSVAVILTTELRDLITSRCSSSKTLDKFLAQVLDQLRDASVEKQSLVQSGMNSEDIKTLVSSNLLTVQGVSNYSFSFPGAGEFMKAYTKGRRAVVNALKKAKYRQIHRSELELRVMKKAAPLGVAYHIHDIIGADIVTRMETTTGEILRLDD